ncbi:MAG: Fe2+-dependent dioxygenase [Gammaproteobacteria bacterium]|nr:Fe2+-dependent dioxygenase [Gammaproteobacteria bacterium]
MLLKIPNVIDASQLNVMQQALKEAPFIDGKLSAGKKAQQVKNNQEVDQASEMARQLSQILMGNLHHNDTFKNAALPHLTATPYFAKYTKGMTYGNHIDDPIMGQEQRFRCDVACTIFMNNPDEYDGGELTIQTQFGNQTVKLPAGDAVLYPASSLHQVAEITRGERIVAVTWIQSLVRDPAKRELLYELNLAREKLMQEKPEAEETAQIDHSYTNLVRMWAEV